MFTLDCVVSIISMTEASWMFGCSKRLNADHMAKAQNLRIELKQVML